MRRSGFDPYEHRVESYEDWFEKNEPAYLSELLAVKALLPSGDKGIEVGVGTGRFAASLGVPVGLDPSISMMKAARLRGVEVVRGVAESLPFKDASLDLVLMVTVVFLLEDAEAAFKEAHRALRSGGSLVVGFIDKNSFLGRSYESKKEMSTFYKDACFLSAEEMGRLLEKTGFGELEFVQTIFHDLDELETIEPPELGYGQGSFVAVRSVR